MSLQEALVPLGLAALKVVLDFLSFTIFCAVFGRLTFLGRNVHFATLTSPSKVSCACAVDRIESLPFYNITKRLPHTSRQHSKGSNHTFQVRCFPILCLGQCPKMSKNLPYKKQRPCFPPTFITTATTINHSKVQSLGNHASVGPMHLLII